MKPRTPVVVTFGGPWFVTIEPLPAHVIALHEERALLNSENARLRGKLSQAKDALRCEVDRRAGRVEREDVAVADRRATR